MPKLYQAQTFAEPEVGSVMDVLRIAAIGHMPRKTEAVHFSFPIEGFGLVLQGRGFYQLNERRKIPLVAPAVFYIWPGESFYYGPEPGTSWEERYLCFTGSRVDDWVRWRWLPHSEEPRFLSEAYALTQQHQRISQAFAHPASHSIEQAKLETEQLVYALYQQTLPKPREEDELAALIRKWMASPETEVDVHAVAAGLEMSYSSFRKHFEQRTGWPPYQFLLRMRIDRASARLTRTDELIKTIAFECGFDFVESFNRAFRQLKGVTPTEYRRQMSLLTGGLS